ncbi:MAG: SDR family NAD(P)-dependent oxidoreductase [Anaerolineales bacterium]|nr:SDR family NAD(P)-dependent oxidoreductase [Anaerolineales bacterium]
MRLKEKRAIVTGGGRGIGRAIALAFAREGANVAVSARSSNEIETVRKEILELGPSALAFPGDVSIERDVRDMVSQVAEKFGGIDILVNNAGVHIRSPVVDMKLEDWELTMAVNLRGPFLCTKAVLPYMMEQRSGKIINISSDSGKKGWATGSAYCASKFGLLGFTEAVSEEVADEYGINVNALCVGGVDTKMAREAIAYAGYDLDWEKVMQPEDIADACIFLASEESRAIHGAFIDIFGLPSLRYGDMENR